VASSELLSIDTLFSVDSASDHQD